MSNAEKKESTLMTRRNPLETQGLGLLDKLRWRDRAEGILHFKRFREAQGKEAENSSKILSRGDLL